MCNLYSITTNQAAIIALFRVVNRYVGNLAPMPGVFPDYPAPVIRNTDNGTEIAMMRWGMPPPPRIPSPPVTNIRNTSSPHGRGWLKPENRCLVPFSSFAEYAPEPNRRPRKKTSCGSPRMTIARSVRSLASGRRSTATEARSRSRRRIRSMVFSRHRRTRWSSRSIYDEALSSPRRELVAVLIWTAVEILFDATSEQNKTRAICEGVSSRIGRDATDCDRIYNLTRDFMWNVDGWYMSGRRLRPTPSSSPCLFAERYFERL